MWLYQVLILVCYATLFDPYLEAATPFYQVFICHLLFRSARSLFMAQYTTLPARHLSFNPLLDQVVICALTCQSTRSLFM